jgi:hypothetical protein
VLQEFVEYQHGRTRGCGSARNGHDRDRYGQGSNLLVANIEE